jgi:L-asparaginase II
VPLCFSPEAHKLHAASEFAPVLNNCSGKHAGMLAFCRLTDRSHEDYIGFDHPIQREIKQAVSHFTDVESVAITTGIDGCSAPNFTLPLIGLARAFGRLARDERDPRYGEAPRVIFAAMTAHPHLVSGTGRSDLAVMQTGGGDWVAKVGGEAVQGIGIRGRGLGIAIKIADGNFRALRPVVVEVLRQLGLVDRPGDTPLEPFVQPPVYNHRHLQTGEIRPRFKLQRVVPHAFAEER